METMLDDLSELDLSQIGRNIIQTTASMLELETTFDISDEDLVFTEDKVFADNDIFNQTKNVFRIRIGKSLYPSWAPTIPFYFPNFLSFKLKHN